jgi:hypothetical protein
MTICVRNAFRDLTKVKALKFAAKHAEGVALQPYAIYEDPP